MCENQRSIANPRARPLALVGLISIWFGTSEKYGSTLCINLAQRRHVKRMSKQIVRGLSLEIVEIDL